MSEVNVPDSNHALRDLFEDFITKINNLETVGACTTYLAVAEKTKYEKPTILIQGSTFSFTLFSKDVISKVIEAKNKSRSERTNGVLQVCNEAIQQFYEEGCIDATRLNTIARYLKKPHRETSSATEAETVPDTYASEPRKIESFCNFLVPSTLKPLKDYLCLNHLNHTNELTSPRNS